MRPALAADHPALRAFLDRHESTSMFPLTNLTGGGLPTRFWLVEVDGEVAGVVGVSATGMVMVQLPGGLGLVGVRAALAGHQVSGLIGPSDQVHVLRAALGLAEVPARHAKDEPGFTLDLADLRLADPQGCRLCPVTAADREVLLPWRAQYEAELFAAPPAEARAAAETQIGRWITADSHRLLWQGDVPVALTGFNARLPQVVQVGGVFVPPGLRGQGHARRAVGMHLAQARAAGVDRAVLFAASEPAERSYRALGFRRGDDMGLVLLARPQEIAA